MLMSSAVPSPHPAPSNFCLNLPSLSRPKLQHSKQHTLHLSYISSQFNSFPPHHTPHPHPSRAGQGGHLMGTMMSDVTRAIKQLPCVSVAAIDGWQHTPYNRHKSLPSICNIFALFQAPHLHLLTFSRQFSPANQALRSVAAPSCPVHATCAACPLQPPFGSFLCI